MPSSVAETALLVPVPAISPVGAPAETNGGPSEVISARHAGGGKVHYSLPLGGRPLWGFGRVGVLVWSSSPLNVSVACRWTLPASPNLADSVRSSRWFRPSLRFLYSVPAAVQRVTEPVHRVPLRMRR